MIVTHLCLKKNVELELKLLDRRLQSLVDGNMLEQVIINLVVNAYNAIPNGGKLVIETRAINLSRNFMPMPVKPNLGKGSVS